MYASHFSVPCSIGALDFQGMTCGEARTKETVSSLFNFLRTFPCDTLCGPLGVHECTVNEDLYVKGNGVW